MDWRQVQAHLQAGTIVGFETGTPGSFFLRFRHGYPDDEARARSTMLLRLAVRVAGGQLCVRDLYDLLSWSADVPEGQAIGLDDGIYHVTLCSRVPDSGILGDGQEILVHLQPLEAWPDLAKEGIPSLRPGLR